ncbi:ABC transporter ATP-binding protein [Solwaraspora sp. WMMD1047]|uniref:ATP-binding cassette domain-containing protein n=1 Tax=Solwaraspora sp. WMMD1047 TaxID=3016102 RepID=UPI002416F129|nr:ABC transporter ATP-binding protein [Solwaraspora sp. WMMD1047]MDG4833952.1 ABC transporter ATP-binding protein [Solwaraspora sp. WMMD1047]
MAREALSLAGPVRGRIIGGMALRAVEGALACGPAILAVAAITDLAAAPLSMSMLAGYAAGCLTLIAAQSTVALVAARLTWTAGYTSGAWLRCTGTRRLVGPWPGQRGLLSGDDVVTVLGSDTRVVENYLGWSLPEIARLAATPVVAFVALVVVAPPVAAVVAVVLAVGWPVYRWAQARYARFATDHRDSRAELDRAVIEHVDGIEVIRAFGLVEQRGNTLARAVSDYRDINTRILRRVVPAYSAFTLLIDLLVVAALAGAALAAAAGGAGAGAQLGGALILALRVAQPLGELAGRLDSLPRTAASVARVRRWHDQQTAEQAVDTAHAVGLVLDAAVLAYDDSRTAAVDGVTLKCPPGTLTVVVGPSGAGKTSLLHLAARIWPPTSGGVHTPEMIALMPQRPSLFSGTVADNIRAGRPGADAELVEAAARAAALHHAVIAMPDGYDAEVGELGNRLSGGERQRLALARALLTDAPLLLLDEPVSALDTGHEQQVIETLTQLRDRGTAVVVVTHRLAIAPAADQVVVMEDGRITDSGTHARVLVVSATYRALWEAHERAGHWRLSTLD